MPAKQNGYRYVEDLSKDDGIENKLDFKLRTWRTDQANTLTTRIVSDVSPHTYERITTIVFADEGFSMLLDHIHRLEDLARAVLSRRAINKAVSGKNMREGLQIMREAEENMQLALDAVLE